MASYPCYKYQQITPPDLLTVKLIHDTFMIHLQIWKLEQKQPHAGTNFSNVKHLIFKRYGCFQSHILEKNFQKAFVNFLINNHKMALMTF